MWHHGSIGTIKGQRPTCLSGHAASTHCWVIINIVNSIWQCAEFYLICQAQTVFFQHFRPIQWIVFLEEKKQNVRQHCSHQQSFRCLWRPQWITSHQTRFVIGAWGIGNSMITQICQRTWQWMAIRGWSLWDCAVVSEQWAGGPILFSHDRCEGSVVHPKVDSRSPGKGAEQCWFVIWCRLVFPDPVTCIYSLSYWIESHKCRICNCTWPKAVLAPPNTENLYDTYYIR